MLIKIVDWEREDRDTLHGEIVGSGKEVRVDPFTVARLPRHLNRNALVGQVLEIPDDSEIFVPLYIPEQAALHGSKEEK